MPLSGLLGQTLGWEYIFYVFGAIGILWYIFWLILIRESPEKDLRISEQERTYIVKSLGSVDHSNPPPTPWRHIWTSTAVWAVVFAHFSENWGYYTLLTQLPTFLNGKFSYKKPLPFLRF